MIIDRIENEMVVCEDENKKIVNIDIKEFVLPIKDGDIVKKNENGLYEANQEETQKRMKNIENRFNSLFK